MRDADDNRLLSEFAERGSEEAFGLLVERHLAKVYSVALRYTNNPAHAEEVAHVVFIILSRKAATLRKNTILSAWLYQTARFTAIALVRGEIRRARREQESFMQALSDQPNSEEIWNQLSPLLDDAIAKLNDKDRAAIVLRFFDGKSLREVGDALSLSEDAAKKRVNRAVDKMRVIFKKRGVAVHVVSLTAIMTAKSVHAAPATLSKSITTSALAKGAAAGGSTGLIKAALKVMAWAQAKTAILVGVAAIVAAGTATIVVREIVARPVAQFEGREVTVLEEFNWQKLAAQGKVLNGAVEIVDGKPVLKLENPNGSTWQLLHISKPSVTAKNYAIIGQIKYENVVGAGHLNMWSFFQSPQPGAQDVQYYSFTGEAQPGPQAQIIGDSDWRDFSLPLDRSGATYPENFAPKMDVNITAKPPTRLEVALFLPSNGVVFLRDVKLVQWK